MPSIVANEATETCLRELLRAEGFRLTEQLENGQTGVDIVATRGSETYHIEVIGHKLRGPARSKDFYEVFFRAISRLNDGAQKIVIALPHLAERGLPQRAKQYGVAWGRLGNAFPELEIWLVNVDETNYRRHSWEEWLR